MTQPENSPTADTLAHLTERVRAFTAARNWEQFHSPKNLVMALCGEVGELTEHFQWKSEEQSRTLEPSTIGEVSKELADVLIYLVRLADVLGIDLPAAAHAKIDLNEKRYPVELSRGSSKKYNEL